MRPMPVFRFGTSAIFALTILIAACGGSSTQAGSELGGRTVTIRVAQDFASFNPQGDPDRTDQQVIAATYASMARVGAGATLIPYVAQSWTVTPTSVTFKVRSGSKCADGTAVTPSLIANSFQHLGTSKDYAKSGSAFGPGGFISATGDDQAGTVTVTVGSPYGDLLYWIAPAAIVCPAGFASSGLLDNQTFGSGPYTIETATHGDQVTLDLRSGFGWGVNGATVTLPKKLILKIITNETTAANLLVTGGMDLGFVSGPDVSRLVSNNSLQHKTADAYQVAWLAMYQGPGRPTANADVRAAIAASIDRSGWNQAANGGRGKPGTSIVSSNAQCYDPTTASLMPTPSTSAAQSLLQSDGYQMVNGKLTKDGSPLTIHLIGPTTTNAGPEYVSTQLTQAGFDVQLKDEDYTAFVHDLIKANFDVAIVPSAVDFPWPTDAIVFFHGAALGQGGFNLFGINDPTLESDVSAAVADSGPDRCKLWGTVQHRLLEQHDLLPLASQSTDWFGHNINFVPGTVITDPLLFS